MKAFTPFTGLERVHFVGIGGAGMSGIAEVLLDPRYGITVTGSDQAASETTAHLAQLGVAIAIGHRAELVHGADLVVISSAVPSSNPEVAEARRLGITVARRAEVLAELMRLKYGIAVAGTHGKTTTTSLIGTLLTESGLDPTVIVGGRLRVSGTGARIGRSDFLVAEADEYDRSFLRLMPVLAVVTNVDCDHLDTYGSMEEIRAAFREFASRVPFFGRVIVCLDDPEIQRLLPALADRRVVTYGTSPQAELVAHDLSQGPDGCHFAVRDTVRGVELGRIDLPLPGVHNVRNALAAVAVGLAVGLDFPAIASSLVRFRGVHRRFERLGTWRGAAVVDDYAHHPTEVAATLEAAHQAFPGARIHAVFQPHLYSRTKDLAADFARALLAAEHAVVTDVYASREAPIPGVSGELVALAARASGHRHLDYVPDWRATPALLAASVAAGDVVLTLGAGDIYRLGPSLLASEAGEDAAAAPAVVATGRTSPEDAR
jgi:UDP-N-acetylmuramate--alanine ligase